MVKLREEQSQDAASIEKLLDICFGDDRHRKASYQFRQNIASIPDLSFVAVDERSEIVGTIRYWPIRLAGHLVLLLGPVAVAPQFHGRGVGRALVFTSLTQAEALGYGTVFLVGDHDYYARFGFSPAPRNIVMPHEQPERLQYRLIGDQSLPCGHCVIEPACERQGALARESLNIT